MMMLTFLLCYVFKEVQPQLNGEFWWLNENIAKYNRALITPPMVEHLSEFDNDDNTNIVFREDNYLTNTAKHKFTSRNSVTTETVRLNSERYNRDLDIDFPQPVKDHNYPSENALKPTVVSIQKTNKNEELPFVFPENSISRYKPEFNGIKNTISYPTVEQITDRQNLVKSPINNNHLGDYVLQQQEHKNVGTNDRPKFNNVHVDNTKNSFEDNNKQTNINDSIIQMSNVFSPTNSTMKNQNNNIDVKDSKLDDRPKFSNVNVADINFNRKDKSKINENVNIVTATLNHIQNISDPKSLNFLSSNKSTNYNNYKNPNYDQNLSSSNFISFQNNNLIRPPSTPKTENTDDVIVFAENSKQLTEAINNRKENKFTFTNRDNNFDDRPKFHNFVIDIPNNNISRSSEQKTTQPNLNAVTTSPLYKQENSHLLLNNKEDDFVFKYPQRDRIVWPDSTYNTLSNNQVSYVTSPTVEVTKSHDSQLLIFGNDQESEQKMEKQNICTYLKKIECQLRKGFVYTVELQIMLAKKAHDPNLICCILPETDTYINEANTKFTHSTNPKIKKRQRRSTLENENKEQKQRKVILRTLATQLQNLKQSRTKTRIVNPEEDYPDPYWNIKNTKFHEKAPENTKYDYSSIDYIEDYVDELPRPGLVGIYSDIDQKKTKPAWTTSNRKPTNYGVDVVYDSVESDEISGYSTVDPRRVVSAKPKRGRPQELSTVSYDKPINPEDQIVNFQSNPDFHVFQGFKLINLGKKRNDDLKGSLIDNTESKSKESEERVETNTSESNDYDYTEDQQLFQRCGRGVEMNKSDRKEKQNGEADSGSHPWLGLVVETKKRFNILCYATIIHPKLAVTAAECVYGSSPGEITILTGLWNLNERSRSRSRVVSIHVHPKYKPGDRSNNLAILFWQQPLHLGINVQPACMAKYDAQNRCKFFGWGGFDQAIRPRSRWQRATIQECKDTLITNKEENRNVFCASIQSRNSVVGLGTPLICSSEGRHMMVGLVVSNDNDLMLTSAQDWVKKAAKSLHLI